MSIATSTVSGLRVNGERLWQSLMTLAQIGATPKGGVARLALTDLDRQGRDLVVGWARELGMTVTIDQIKAIRAFLASAPKVALKQNVTCPKCGFVHNLNVEGLLNFFD